MKRVFAASWLLVLVVTMCPVSALAQQRRIIAFIRDAETFEPIQGTLVELLWDTGEPVTEQIVGADGKAVFVIEGEQIPWSLLFEVVGKAAGFEEARAQVSLRGGLGGFIQATTYLFLRPSDGISEVAENVRYIPRKARQELRKALDLLAEQGEREEAAKHLRRALRKYPDYVEAHHLLGIVLMEQGKWEEAEQELRKALELNDAFAPSYLALGSLRSQQKKLPEAQALLEQGLELDPEDWTGHMELLRTLYGQGDLQQATEHGLEAHRLNPEGLEVHLALADLFIARQAYSQAYQEYRHYLELAPEGAFAEKVKQQMAKLDTAIQQQLQSPAIQ